MAITPLHDCADKEHYVKLSKPGHSTRQQPIPRSQGPGPERGMFAGEVHQIETPNTSPYARLAIMDTVPLLIIFSAVVLIGLIWAALRLTIKRDRDTIKSDMDEPHEVEAYQKRWRKRH